MDSYIADLRAATQMGLDIKIFRMDCPGIPQDRIAKRLGQVRETILGHLPKMATLPNPVIADLSRGFTVAQVAEKHNWTEPMVWSLARLKTGYPGKPFTAELFLRRALTEEVGHLLGIGHCPQPTCVMHFSNSLYDTDRKGPTFCSRCQEFLP